MNKLMTGLAISAICLAYAGPALAQDSIEASVIVETADQSVLADKHWQTSPDKVRPAAAPARPRPEPIEQGYEIAPAMWLLSDEDTSIYMFGTFHVLPEGLKWRTDAFDAVVAEVDELVVETSDSDSEASLTAAMPQMAELMTGQVAISSRLTPKSAMKWRSLAQMLGVSPEQFDQMPVLLAMFSIGVFASQQEGSLSSHGVETILEAEFARTDRPVGSIEDGGDVMLSLLTIDDDLMLAELERGLSEWDGALLEDFMNEDEKPAGNGMLPPQIGRFKQEHSWARGDLQAISEEEFGEGEIGLQVYDVMLSRRNKAWAQWLEDRLDRPGKVLLAVGAGHFGGRDSVIDLLVERGMVPERVQ